MGCSSPWSAHFGLDGTDHESHEARACLIRRYIALARPARRIECCLSGPARSCCLKRH